MSGIRVQISAGNATVTSRLILNVFSGDQQKERTVCFGIISIFQQ
jgi:hypothetical protein